MPLPYPQKSLAAVVAGMAQAVNLRSNGGDGRKRRLADVPHHADAFFLSNMPIK